MRNRGRQTDWGVVSNAAEGFIMDIYSPTIAPITWFMSVGFLSVFAAVVIAVMSPAFKK